MAIYSAYMPGGVGRSEANERVRFVSDSKAPLALVFPPFWLAWNRLWMELMIYLVLALAIALLAVWNPVTPVLYLSAIPGLFLLFEGNELVRRKLERSGWRFAGVVDAMNTEEAEIRYFYQANTENVVHRPTHHVTRAAVPAPPRSAPVGLFPE